VTDAKYTVLVVDDTKENIDVLNGILKQEYRVKFAISGEMALSIAEKSKPDIILLDIMMPEMDGYEVCHRLKENPVTRHIPVIFVTAKNEEVDEIQGFEVGAVDYITKPVSPPVVKSRLKTHLALANQQRELEIQVAERTSLLNDTRMEIVRVLGRASEFKDNETGMHVMRMSGYSYEIALEYGLDPREAELLQSVAPMHDVGKIGIPDCVLQKPGKLDADEMDIMRTHAMIGCEILGTQNSALLKTARIIAGQHHEKWDGNGYPKGLKDTGIHLFARIIAVADVFDALTSKRPYKEAWSVEDAVALIRSESGKHFDPDVVDAFNRALDRILEIKIQYSEDGGNCDV